MGAFYAAMAEPDVEGIVAHVEAASGEVLESGYVLLCEWSPSEAIRVLPRVLTSAVTSGSAPRIFATFARLIGLGPVERRTGTGSVWLRLSVPACADEAVFRTGVLCDWMSRRLRYAEVFEVPAHPRDLLVAPEIHQAWTETDPRDAEIGLWLGGDEMAPPDVGAVGKDWLIAWAWKALDWSPRAEGVLDALAPGWRDSA